MKWIKTLSVAENQEYELWDDNIKSMSLSISSNGYAKIRCNDTRRTFLIEKKGIFRSRIILRNEYGSRLGQLTFEGNHFNEGFIDMEGLQLRYSIHKEPTPELVIYKSSNDILLICDLVGITATFLKNPTENIYSALLLALCWHQTTKVLKTPELEFAL